MANKNILKFPLISLLLLASCSASTPKKVTPSAAYWEQVQSNAKNIKTLEEQNGSLKKINASLETKIEESKNEIALLKKKQSEQLKNMDDTISLLELNIKDLQKKYAGRAGKDATYTLATKSRKNSGDLGNLVQQSAGIEIKIPANSTAIENFSLNEGTAKKTTPETQKNTKNVLAITSKKEKKMERDWEDDDLQSPQSPIFLEAYPGAKKHYNNAFRSYTLRDYVKAIELFEDFLVRYPNDQYADNSQFWIGEAYFNLKDYPRAEHAFRKILRNYEHGKTREGFKTPDAILMLGRLSLINGKPVKARKYFEHVIKQYPNSRSADKAAKEIQSMRSL